MGGNIDLAEESGTVLQKLVSKVSTRADFPK
jgi:hypothetical protein